jgi:hypothetical protein
MVRAKLLLDSYSSISSFRGRRRKREPSLRRWKRGRMEVDETRGVVGMRMKQAKKSKTVAAMRTSLRYGRSVIPIVLDVREVEFILCFRQ